MAKKRPSLKDKNVFQRSKNLQTLFGSSEETDASAEEKQTPDKTTESAPPESASAPETPANDPSDFSALADEIAAAESASEITPPTIIPPDDSIEADDVAESQDNDEDEIDLDSLLSVETTAAASETLPAGESGNLSPEVDDFADFPVALETPPDDIVSPEAGTSEIGDEAPEIDDFADFPAALEEAPVEPDVGASTGGEAGDLTPGVDDFLDFPVAMESPPGATYGAAGTDVLDFPAAEELAPDDFTTEAMPSGEAGDLDSDVDELLDFPTAVEPSPADFAAEAPPSNEAGDIVPDVDDFFDFPAAAETPPAGEADDFASDVDDFSDFPTALEPAAENGDFNADFDFSAAAAEPLDASLDEDPDFDFADSALAEDTPPLAVAETAVETATAATAATPITSRPVPPPASPPPVYSSSTPQPESVSSASVSPFMGPVVSRTTPLTVAGEDIPDDILGYRNFDDTTNRFTFDLGDEVEELTEEERKQRIKLLKDPRIKDQFLQVYNAIDAQYEHILSSNISVSKSITDWAHKLLGETRFIIMNYQIEYLAKAEWNIEQVRARLDRAEESEKQARIWTIPIVIWAMLWFFIFVYFLFNPDWLLGLLIGTNSPSNLLIADIFLRTLALGGIGGVTAVFYNLLQYVTRRQFDPQFNVSYFAKPIMGMTLATLIYLLVFVTMRVLGILPDSLGEPAADDIKRVQYFTAIAWTFAFAAGFKENVAFDLLDRVMKILLRRTSNKSDEVKAPPPPPGPYDSVS